MFKKLLFFGFLMSYLTTIKAQTTLTAGDMAIVGINYDAVPYEMAIVNLVPLSAGTVVRITDYAFDEATGTFSTVSTANTSEGSIQWTLTSAMAAGTVTKFTINAASGTPVITGLPGTVSVTGWTNTLTTACPSPAGGDNWFIFQGSSPTNVTTYVFAWCNPFATTHNGVPQIAGQFLVSGSGVNNNGNSYLPPSLTLGTNAISLSYDPSLSGYHGDNNVYIGPKTGTKSSLISAISTISNWNRNETTTYDLNPGGSNFPGSNPVFTISTPNNSPTDITLSSSSTNENVPANTTIGNFSSTDPDAGNTFTYSLVSGTGSTDNAAFNISSNALRINLSPDFELQNSYSIRVRTTDQGGLFFEKQFTITIINLCDIVLNPLSQTNVACNGGASGAAMVNNATGGSGGYTYNWTPGNPSGDGTTSVTGLTAGTWTCTVTDSSGCTASYNFTITQPTVLNATAQSQTNVSCNGGANGAASINTPTGGAGGYTYNWTPGNPTGDGTTSVTGLTAGLWTCTVTDANGCTTTRNFTITQPSTINVNPASQTNVSCNGGSNGAASINTPTGGTGGYTYNWTPGNPSGDGTTTVTGLTAGTWTCTVTDANGCTKSTNFTITQPPALSVTALFQNNVSCNGGSNGAASINTPTGGAGGYTYDWTPGNPTGDGTTSVTGLTAGTWTCTITDANSCTTSVNFTITQPTALIATALSQTNVSCNGGSNGAASINIPTGGAGGYTYNWTPGNPTGDGTTSVTGLTAGTWTCTITDANSCTTSVNFTITQPTALNATALSQTNISCNGGSNGAASINIPTGGAGGYTYNWTPGNPTGDGTTSVTGLTAGTWTCTVTDANGCTTSVNFTITQPTALIASAQSQTNISCNGGSNGAASINIPTGGAGGYTYDWTPGNPTGDGTTSVTGLTAGTWTCTITDANSCTTSVNFTITQPTALIATALSQTNISCNGGSNGAASINIPTGGAGGYTYDWTPGNPTGDGTTSVTGLTAGTWTCTITDANSCTTSVNFTITQPTALIATALSQTNVSCNGGSNGAASINIPTGGAGGYTYNWTPGNPTGDGTTSVTGLTAGTWTCTITDANGCTTSVNFTITEPAPLDNSVTLNSGVLQANLSGASYQWYQCPNTILTGETNQTFTPTVVGDYKVEITLGGCSTFSTCVTVTSLSIDNFVNSNLSFYPNPTSDILYLKNNQVIEDIEVINMIGQQVIQLKNTTNELQLDVTSLPSATYFIKIKTGGLSKLIKIIKK
ncbi:Protein of unknown function precursor; putative adhesin [Flavobacterium indicum GPTSA100-9 = DSM 17447]|uniref:Cadherin domain-containing protein n=1 Tax=Flavobacterium indicum (strain DSM 17447 / CIP 109464 / GPTSA100-9) TaxID=1094466 RepID=H8XVA1_FLAIG|nr:T9SS type A sorting domain-containing protein [Flavobacterium indicum]CCG53071.1 Protein of unknown function precursor; putative adhesin [Flavobacterium indicum GPTSA100-9 = DSM 17447]